MNNSFHKTISLTDLEKIYDVVNQFGNLIMIYENEIEEKTIKPMHVESLNSRLICTGLDIERINNKILTTKSLHEIYSHKYHLTRVEEMVSSDKILFTAVIPKTEELLAMTKLSEKNLRLTLQMVAYDFVKLFDGNNNISNKILSIVFIVSEKSLSYHFNKYGLKKKQYYNDKQIDQAVGLVLHGKTHREAQNLSGVNQSTIRNYTQKMYRDEAKLNALPTIDIDHNEAIQSLGRIAQERGFCVYSEHISDFNTDIGDNFRNIDLLLLKNDIIYCAVEIEKSHGLSKSLSNLFYHFKDVKYKILFVTEQAIPKAYSIRKEMGIAVNEVRIIKLHENFEKTFIKLMALPRLMK